MEPEHESKLERSERKMSLGTTVILLLLFFGLLAFGGWSCSRVLLQSQFM